MQKLTINADGNLNEEAVRLALSALGEVTHESIQTVTYEARGNRNRSVWLYLNAGQNDAALLVEEDGDLEGIALTSEQYEQLVNEGVCVNASAIYPRTDRYGTPDWAVNPSGGTGELIPAREGFKVGLNDFDTNFVSTSDDSGEDKWLEIAVPEDSFFLTLFDQGEKVDQRMQVLCDQIRRNMTEEEIKTALEGAGFSVFETGQELVEAVAQAISEGDVSESVLGA